MATTVHAARGLLAALVRVERLLHLAKIVYTVMYRTITGLLTADI